MLNQLNISDVSVIIIEKHSHLIGSLKILSHKSEMTNTLPETIHF